METDNGSSSSSPQKQQQEMDCSQLLQGYLLKRGHIWKSWRKRYFILTSTHLEYYKDQTSKQPIDKIPLTNARLEQDSATSQDSILEKKPFRFKLIAPEMKKTFYFQSSSKSNFESWTKCLQKSISQLSLLHQLQDSLLKSTDHENDDQKIQSLTEWAKSAKPLPHFCSFCKIANPKQSYDVVSKNDRVMILSSKMSKQQIVARDMVKKLCQDESSYLSDLPDPLVVHLLEFISYNLRDKVYCEIRGDTGNAEEYLSYELFVLSSVRHPNIQRFYESYFHDNDVWILLEHLEEGQITDLLDCFQQVKPDESHIAYVALQTLKAIHYLHSNNIIHRDIRSDSLFVGSRGQIKLGGFQYSVILTNERPRRNTVIGTPYWLSPELVRGANYSTKSDIYSFGIVMYELNDGEPPYMNFPPLRALFLTTTKELPQLKNFENLSQEFIDFCSHCTEKDPDSRYSSSNLLQHPFLKKACTPSHFLSLVQAKKKYN